MIGKKRTFDGNRNILPPPKVCSSDLINNMANSSSEINSSNIISENQKKDISFLYNMKKSIYLSCVHTKHAKYSNNKYIPCLPFSS